MGWRAPRIELTNCASHCAARRTLACCFCFGHGVAVAGVASGGDAATLGLHLQMIVYAPQERHCARASADCVGSLAGRGWWLDEAAPRRVVRLVQGCRGGVTARGRQAAKAAHPCLTRGSLTAERSFVEPLWLFDLGLRVSRRVAAGRTGERGDREVFAQCRVSPVGREIRIWHAASAAWRALFTQTRVSVYL